ncbi:MAG: hypothetical protein U0694_26260 [Anaerolineae bacterium]
MAHTEDLALDGEGKAQLPQQARTPHGCAARFAVEIRPEGVLLRPEVDELDGKTTLHDVQDAPPPKRASLFGRLLRRNIT